MPRTPREELFNATEVGILHCVQRCVRRAFLAGVDAASGESYEFRREWIRRRMELLASVFGVDILTYAILSNHLHIVIRNRPDIVTKWSYREIAVRWLRVFPGRRIEEQLAEPTKSDVDKIVNNKERMAIINLRLSDPSWFMRALCEPIARMANLHDKCTGRFWEGRFRAQKIADESGLLACCMYVDLNPIRAAIVATLEQSVYTSAYDRIRSIQGVEINSAAAELAIASNEESGKRIRDTPVKKLKEERLAKKRLSIKKIPMDAWLAPMKLDERISKHLMKGSLSHATASSSMHRSRSGVRASDKGFLSMSTGDYLLLLEWTGQQTRASNQGKVPDNLQPILGRLGIDASMWCDLVWDFKKYFGGGSAVGSPYSLNEDAKERGREWSRGQRSSSTCFVNQSKLDM